MMAMPAPDGVSARAAYAAKRVPSRLVSSMSRASWAPPRIGGRGGRLSVSKHMLRRIARFVPGSPPVGASADEALYRDVRAYGEGHRHDDVHRGANDEGHRSGQALARRRAPHARHRVHAGRRQEESERRADREPPEMALPADAGEDE